MKYCSSMIKIEKKYNALKRQQPSARLGQMFCNLYVKHFDNTTSSLFNQPDDTKAKNQINQWLLDNGYADTLPDERQLQVIADSLNKVTAPKKRGKR